MLQAHSFLDEIIGYYGNLYSTHRKYILWFLRACYNVNPPNLQRKYYGYFHAFSVQHTLSGSNGGIVISCHNKIRDNIIHLSRQAFSYHCVCGKTLIHQGLRKSEGVGV